MVNPSKLAGGLPGWSKSILLGKPLEKLELEILVSGVLIGLNWSDDVSDGKFFFIGIDQSEAWTERWF